MTPKLSQTLLSLGLCAFAYLFVSPYFPRINNPNENVRLYMTAAIVEEGRYEIDGLRQRWGYVNDAAKYEGHVYSVKAPGTSFLGVPPYALLYTLTDPLDRDLALLWCRLSASVLPTLLFLFYFHRYLGRHSRDPVLRESVFFSVALGSMLYGYGLLYVSHTLSAVCAFGAFMLLSDGQRVALQRSSAALAGLLAAGVALFEYPGFIASLVLCGLAAHRLHKAPVALCCFAAGALVPTLAMMHFQHHAFGSPFTPGHLYVENASFRAAHHEGLYGAVGVSAKALYGLLLDPGCGLFPLTPILLAAPLGLGMLLRVPGRRALASACGLLILGTVLVIAAMNNWRGGWTIGPRYLALCVPFMGFLALIGLEGTHARLRPWVRVFAVAGLAVGLSLSGSLSAYYPHLPPELTRPAFELLPVLVRDGFAPRNALQWLGVYGTASMLPLLLCGAVVLWRSADRSPRMLGAGVVIAALSMALLQLPTDAAERRAQGAVGFITRTWSPEGHDRAAVLLNDIRQSAEVRPSDVEQLRQLYLRQGRTSEARQLDLRYPQQTPAVHEESQ